MQWVCSDREGHAPKKYICWRLEMFRCNSCKRTLDELLKKDIGRCFSKDRSDWDVGCLFGSMSQDCIRHYEANFGHILCSTNYELIVSWKKKNSFSENFVWMLLANTTPLFHIFQIFWKQIRDCRYCTINNNLRRIVHIIRFIIFGLFITIS